ncbi:MAG: M14 family metallopeptidase, partial [Gemmatimonadota bacterium]
MRICSSKGMAGLALFLALVLLSPGPGQGQTASYLNHDGLTRELRSMVNSSNLATMESLGTTLQGREIWMVTVGNSSGAPLAGRPGILVVGNLEGDHLVGSQLALEAIRYLIANAREEAVQASLNDHVFYFFPRLNPDGAEAMFARVKWDRKTNTRPFDDDNDGRIDEDGPEDLNGDGYITVMREADPSGAYMIDPDNERLMKRADPTKGETGAFTLYWEGTDEDGDGFINEDGPGGVDLNRNFQHEYPYWQADAGLHMVSEVESRALMDFTISHRNIDAILTFGETDNLVTPPDSRGGLAAAKVPDLPIFADASNADVLSVGVFAAGGGGGGRGGGRGGGGGGIYLRGAQVGANNDPSSGTRPSTTVATQDLVYFTAASDAYKRITGIENVPVHRTPEGAFFQYGYFQYGVLSFSTLGWGVPAGEAGGGERTRPTTEP